MKIAITGKGGVGKTTFAAMLAGLYAIDGRPVLAVDVDPDANLGLALGFNDTELASVTPISKLSDLIAERTGADRNNSGLFFKINPRVDDIPERFSLDKNGTKLLVMGTVETGGTGCVCPEHVVLKRVISHLVLNVDEVVILDMEAGLEHLGRGTASMVDIFIVVVEPGTRSIQTFGQIKKLAADLGVTEVKAVANKIKSDTDKSFITSKIPAEDILGFIGYSTDIADADRDGIAATDITGETLDEVKRIKERIDNEKTV